MKPEWETVWERIAAHQREPFSLKRGEQFEYEVSGSSILVSRTEYVLSKPDAHKVFLAAPLSGPGEVSDLVRGSSYLWAILHDSRITLDEWC